MSAATLTAGRELDALIAEKVMGIDPASFRYMARREAPFPNEDGTTPVTVIGSRLTRDVAEEVCERENGYVTADHRELHGEFRVVVNNVEPYSTDIAAAWLVVEKLLTSWAEVSVAFRGEFSCVLWRDADSDWDIWEEAATAPLAICLAALKAVEANR